ncbi:mastermind-like protein 2 [Aplochiton taeniatus]
MGEATPAQPTVGGFVPMLGVGMVGSMPGGVNGPIATSRGSAVPQLHSAIVERLRARIELCRRHHSTCENRYQRGQAENSDREHESTLHLLNIVQQGPGNRKTKGSRSSNHQPPEYSRANGEQKSQSSEGEQKISTRIALQGSLRRKIEGHAPGYSNKQNGLACGLSGPDFKRVRMEAGGLGHGLCAFNPAQPQSHQGTSSSAMGNNHSNPNGLQRKSYMMPHGVGSDLFHMTLKEMKKEPVDSVQSCGQSAATEMMVFDFKDEGGGQIDPDLQDLFDELTKTVPSLNDLEFEKMLKQDDAFGMDLGGRPSSAGAGPGPPAAAANLCSQLEKTIKTEYSPDYGQVHCGSPQLRPASAGPSFTMGGGASPIARSQKANGQGGHPRGMPGWLEVSHAEQLKQMAAANQQQPNALLHHHHHHHHHNHQQLQQQQPGGVTSWAPAMSTHSSSGSFPQDKLSSSATLGQQRLSPQSSSSLLAPILANSSQSKGINATANNNNNCLFKPSNGHSDSGHLDMKVLGTKPMLHFTPKTASSVNQPVMTGQLSKTQAQQQAVAGQTPSHSGLPYQNQQMPMVGSPCLQPKPMTQRPALNQHGPSLHFKLAQQRQGMPPGAHLPANSSGVGMASQAQSQLRASVPNNQQKSTGKTQAMQRTLNQPQHLINDTEKDSAQDQFNRHLTRPPPDYKQNRNMVGVQQGSLFQGMTSSQSLPSSGPEGDLQPMGCHLPNGPGSKMTPPSSDRRFGPDPHPGSCIGQLQPQHNSNQNRLGINQNKLRFPGKPGNQGNAFGVNSNVQQHPRTAVAQQSSGGGVAVGGGGIGNMMSNVMGWSSSGSKPTNAVGTGGLAIRRLLNPIQPQGVQLDMIRHPYQQQRSVGPPNQVAPDIRMHPLSNATLRGSTPRSNQPMMAPLPPVGVGLNLSPPEQRGPPGAGSFPATAPSPNPGNYQNNRASRLTFDFLQEGDNTVPGINTDSDFIDSLLKSGSGNDDWMKDINLDEILGGHS